MPAYFNSRSERQLERVKMWKIEKHEYKSDSIGRKKLGNKSRRRKLRDYVAVTGDDVGGGGGGGAMSTSRKDGNVKSVVRDRCSAV